MRKEIRITHYALRISSMAATNSQSNKTTSPSSYLRIVGWTVGGLAVALLVAVMVASSTFGMALYPMPKDLRDLTVFLLISGAVSVLLAVLVFRLGLGTRIPSLTITLTLVYLAGVAVVAVNVLYTAVNMFLSREHDL